MNNLTAAEAEVTRLETLIAQAQKGESGDKAPPTQPPAGETGATL